MGRKPDHEQKFYYGQHCVWPKKVGDLAIHTWTITPNLCVMELNIGIGRKEIGRIEMIDRRAGADQTWITVFDETRDQRDGISYDDPRIPYKVKS